MFYWILSDGSQTNDKITRHSIKNYLCYLVTWTNTTSIKCSTVQGELQDHLNIKLNSLQIYSVKNHLHNLNYLHVDL